MSKATGCYRHLGRRILNEPTGKLGLIVAAERQGRTWYVTVQWDGKDRAEPAESTQALWLYNHLVADGWRHEHGDVERRRTRLIERAMSPSFRAPRSGWLGWRVPIRCAGEVGEDSIYVGRETAERLRVTLTLWGIGSESAESNSIEGCLEQLRQRRAFAA